MADCGLRQIAALTGLWRIADCTLDPLRCEDPRQLTCSFGRDETASDCLKLHPSVLISVGQLGRFQSCLGAFRHSPACSGFFSLRLTTPENARERLKVFYSI
eukprot:9046576-Alexandrium_andersonii.AAC.1